jgi:putative transposase
MPYIKIWIHLVWSTKKRQPFLTKDIRQKVFMHIRENAKEKNIYLDFVNGYTDHIHCLISLSNEQTIANVVQLIKGESSFWINKNNLCKGKFEWQGEYFAVSVSESGVSRVREYIRNQEEHHATKTFEQEYDEFINKYGFEIISPCPEGHGN